MVAPQLPRLRPRIWNYLIKDDEGVTSAPIVSGVVSSQSPAVRRRRTIAWYDSNALRWRTIS
jgi:hypothetical protein